MNQEAASAPAPDIGKALRDIRNAWIAAIVVNLLTLTGIMGWVYGVRILDILDVVLVFGLAYGIYRRSQACAAIMAVYFILQKALFMLIAFLPLGIAVSAIFVYLFYRGLIGTMDYRASLEPEQDPAGEEGA